VRERETSGVSRNANVDEDEDQLAGVQRLPRADHASSGEGSGPLPNSNSVT